MSNSILLRNKDKGLGRSLARQREGHHGLDWEKIREELRKKEKEREEQEKKDK